MINWEKSELYARIPDLRVRGSEFSVFEWEREKKNR